MTADEIKHRIETGESCTIEFKRSTAKLKSAAETLCAFLNHGNGGVVFIGVSDDKKIIGQQVTDRTKLEIANMLRKFEPAANITVDYVPLDINKTIVVLEAHPDKRCIPYSFDGRSYERNESETCIMPQARYQQLILTRSLIPYSWESLSAPALSIEHLDSSEILKTVNEGVSKGRLDPAIETNNISEILTRFNLLNNGQLNNAAAVLFLKTNGEDIPPVYVQCVLRMARFKGLEKNTFIDSKHVYGNAFYLLREAEAFIRRNTAVTSHLEQGKMARVDKTEYPFVAIREALVNAVCHRDYASSGGSITLTIYDNRLEIANTGLLPEGISLDDLKKTHTSHPRNPNMLKIFYRRGLIESMGMGTQQIVKACTNANQKEPEFYEQAGAFVVRLWSQHNQTGLTSDRMNDQLSKRQRKILTLLTNSSLAPQEILHSLEEKISDRTLRRELLELKNKGYVDNEGQLGPKTRWFIKTRT